MQYKYPDKKEMEVMFKLHFKSEFLRINNLKIGDEIEMEFPFERVSRYKNSENKVTFQKKLKGILKETEEGFLIAESLDILPFFKYINHIRRPYYESTPRKSVIKFGTGFIN